MRYRMWFILLGVFACQSCTHDFSLKEMDAESKAVLFCMPFTGSDTTLIQVARSRPIHRQETSTDGQPYSVIQTERRGEGDKIHGNSYRFASGSVVLCIGQTERR